MYLARYQAEGKTRYAIRESYPDDDMFRSRDLIDLGEDPGAFLRYPGGNAFYVHEAIEDQLRSLHVTYDMDELDEVFWAFVRPDIQKAQAYFRRRGASGANHPTDDPSENLNFHLFDRRRVHFLRFGQTDQGRIGMASPKLFKGLARKSRDEIEQHFMLSEQILKPHELKSYVFVIFDIQRHFSEHFARSMPQGLDQNAVDTLFVQDICRLNRDDRFWADLRLKNHLHEYLVRYLVTFFDNDYGRSGYLEDLLQSWMNSRRGFRFPERKPAVSFKEAGSIFGISEDEMRRLSKKELSRLFRRKAQEMHPDKGGDHDAFIHLADAYREIKNKKK
ncbi:J domain-containing protein [Desulfococcus sp.]|uniref:J domain-containing protein n=1 Tax=Desulfococcus sp. TaxID=2025834 RepID=UPI003593F8EF